MEIKVILNGVEEVVSKHKLLVLAARGAIGPNTIITVDGEPLPAENVKDLAENLTFVVPDLMPPDLEPPDLDIVIPRTTEEEEYRLAPLPFEPSPLPPTTRAKAPNTTIDDSSRESKNTGWYYPIIVLVALTVFVKFPLIFYAIIFGFAVIAVIFVVIIVLYASGLMEKNNELQKKGKEFNYTAGIFAILFVFIVVPFLFNTFCKIFDPFGARREEQRIMDMMIQRDQERHDWMSREGYKYR